ncbi:MAG: hypothetical protein WC284_11485 [Candidimonas sp.]
MRIKEIYSRNNLSVLKYFKDENIDIYGVWYDFVEWVDQNDLFDEIVKHIDIQVENIDHLHDIDPSVFYKLPTEIQEEFFEHYKEDVIPKMMRDFPSEAPTSAHFSLNRPQLLNRKTWLVHFSDHARDIAANGFKYGIDDIERLGLTTWMSDSLKKYGGYNFAYMADDRNVRNGKKYGKEFVMFQNSGVHTYHYGDEEDQVIFYGPEVDYKKIIWVKANYDSYCVMPHPLNRHYGQDTKSGGIFCSENVYDVISWVTKNWQQYKKILML